MAPGQPAEVIVSGAGTLVRLGGTLANEGFLLVRHLTAVTDYTTSAPAS
jgi:hypothetical protein